MLGINCEECTDEQVLWNHRQAQRWMAIAEAPGGGDLLDYDGASDWVIREPYAAAGGGVIGESPATTVTEFRLTPFDDLIYNDEEASTPSELYPGKVIGFSISHVGQRRCGLGRARACIISLSGNWQVMINANLFSDGLLVGAGEDPSSYDDVSAVEPSSWGQHQGRPPGASLSHAPSFPLAPGSSTPPYTEHLFTILRRPRQRQTTPMPDPTAPRPPAKRGRAAGFNTPNRFEPLHLEPDPAEPGEEGFEERVATQYLVDASRSILAENDSPDVGFRFSLNPYRGCEHGCVYCYARPSHEYLGFSAGLDFETKILVKEQAPELLEAALRKRSWQPQVVALSGNTDCYQPVERRLQLTRDGAWRCS